MRERISRKRQRRGGTYAVVRIDRVGSGGEAIVQGREIGLRIGAKVFVCDNDVE